MDESQGRASNPNLKKEHPRARPYNASLSNDHRAMEWSAK